MPSVKPFQRAAIEMNPVYRVRFVNPQEHYRRLKPEIDRALIDTLERGDLVAERTRLRAPVLDQDVAEPEARLADDIVEQDRLVALRGQCADIVDPHGLD